MPCLNTIIFFTRDEDRRTRDRNSFLNQTSSLIGQGNIFPVSFENGNIYRPEGELSIHISN